MTITITEMSPEDLDNMFNQYEIAILKAGYPNSRAMEDFKHNACEGMIKFGGGFTSHLGHALARADIYNSLKILKTFDEECREHANLFIKFMEKRNNETL